MKSTLELVTEIIEQNPEAGKNPKYLILSVWERQGLKLHPIQRETFLSDAITNPATILRSIQKVKPVDKAVAVRKRK